MHCSSVKRNPRPELQEQAVKFLDLAASSMILFTSIDVTTMLWQMATDGWTVRADGLAAISPHWCDNVLHFGDYDTSALHIPPGR
ncbi:Tn3 family transposase [Streptomyces sp. NPDC052396]|uniref:Tn3 family transposase n=1 Tax=Streptomyces sp. NPDC052396 TaxID=3365689 RepID=UPI0037D4CD89